MIRFVGSYLLLHFFFNQIKLRSYLLHLCDVFFEHLLEENSSCISHLPCCPSLLGHSLGHFLLVEELAGLINAGFEQWPVLQNELDILDGQISYHASDFGGIGVADEAIMDDGVEDFAN